MRRDVSDENLSLIEREVKELTFDDCWILKESITNKDSEVISFHITVDNTNYEFAEKVKDGKSTYLLCFYDGCRVDIPLDKEYFEKLERAWKEAVESRKNFKTRYQKYAEKWSREVRWSDEDGCYVGSLPELCGNCCDGTNIADVLKTLDEIAEDYARDELDGWYSD